MPALVPDKKRKKSVYKTVNDVGIGISRGKRVNDAFRGVCCGADAESC